MSLAVSKLWFKKLFNGLGKTRAGLLSLPLKFAESWIGALLHDQSPKDAYQKFELADDAYCSRRLKRTVLFSIAVLAAAATQQNTSRPHLRRLHSARRRAGNDLGRWRPAGKLPDRKVASRRRDIFEKAHAYSLSGVMLDGGRGCDSF